MTDLQNMLKLLKKAGADFKKYRETRYIKAIHIIVNEGCRDTINMRFDLRGNIIYIEPGGF